MTRQQILCVMRMPPNLNGHGGSQRAWHLLHALLPLGDIHFVLLYRSMDRDCVDTSLQPIEAVCATVNRIEIPAWNPSLRYKFLVVPPGLWDMLRLGTPEAPSLSRRDHESIAKRLPINKPDILFACRLSCAFVMQDLLEKRLLAATVRVVDFDDIMSKFVRRRIEATKSGLRLQSRIRAQVESHLIVRCENKIADAWHGMAVCTEEDAADLRAGNPNRLVAKIPNVVIRDRLPPPEPGDAFQMLFVGNLGFPPNVDGLTLFVEKALALVRSHVPGATLTVVGINPDQSLVDLLRRHGVRLYGNAPLLEPHYRSCDVVIAPILFGSGTRIKILEAMAYGRPVVATTMGAEGMGLVDGKHLLIADDMGDFARALVRLAQDVDLYQTLVQQAHDYQQRSYTPEAMKLATASLIDEARIKATSQAKPA